MRQMLGSFTLMAGLIVAITAGLPVSIHAQEAGQPARDSDKPIQFSKRESQPGDDELRRALIERYNAAVENYPVQKAAYEAGVLTLDRLLDAAAMVTRSALDLCATPAEELSVWKTNLALLEQIEAREAARLKKGSAAAGDFSDSHLRTLDARVALIRAKRKAEAGK